MALADPRTVLRQLGVRPRTGAGQHFLVDPKIADRHVGHARIAASDRVLEIGPGIGILTERLAARARRVIAIEMDRRLAAYLREAVPDAEIVSGDALTEDWPAFDVMVSNLPYQISSPVTFKLLAHPFDRAVLMYQWEFARRMVAKPATRDYSRLTVGVFRRAACEVLERIPRNAFHPQPRVDSAIVRLAPRPSPFPIDDPELYDRLVAALFEHRRKTIENGLRLVWPALEGTYGPLEPLLECLPFRGRRVGELGPEEIAALVHSVSAWKAHPQGD